MKLTALGLMVMCGGCSLYFGSSSPPADGDLGPPPPWYPDPPPDAQNVPPPWYPDAPSPPPQGPDAGVPDPTCGGPRVEVFSVYTPRTDQGLPHGAANVTIDQPGLYRLVLSAYDATKWHVELGAGAKLDSIYLYGYYDQEVDVLDVPVTSHSNRTNDYGCGYSYPYNGQGCNTNDLLSRVAVEAGPLHGFHGCYLASQWKLGPDGTVTSDCDASEGYKQYDFVPAACMPPPPPPPHPPGDWVAKDFRTFDPALCTGARFVHHDVKYDAWVGAIQCGDPQHYKLYMSRKRDGVYLEIADFAGNGQDHCELVNPSFTLPNEDDITSGGCLTCSLGELVDIVGKPVFARDVFGQQFKRVESTDWADLTTDVYACGVSIP